MGKIFKTEIIYLIFTFYHDSCRTRFVELLHNGNPTAKCYGEAKNYDLLSSHLNTFAKWLEDVKFKSDETGTPPDLAFMIAPDCSPLLQRKLELQNIYFIQSSKIDPLPIEYPKITKPNSVDINTAKKEVIMKAFKGTQLKKLTFEKLIDYRKNKSFKNLDDLVSIFNWSPKVRQKLQEKLDNGEIYFSQNKHWIWQA